MRRKTRFVCVSDTHGYTPSEAGFKLPAGDVLVHAGDLTNTGSKSELSRTIDWISQADYEIKIIVAGNHDVTLDPGFYTDQGQGHGSSELENSKKCMDIVRRSSPSVLLLQHQAAVVRLTRADGPQTIFKIFGSPYSQFHGNWAFGYEATNAAALWDQIPLDTDILVTHTPPRSHCDQKSDGTFVGCNPLREAISRIRPPLAICGHVHEGRGYQIVRWSPAPIESGNDSDNVGRVTRGVLPPSGSRKQALVDLTGKRGDRLDNDGYSCSHHLASDQTASISLASRGLAAGDVPDQGDQRTSPDTSPLSTSASGPGPISRSWQDLRKETCIVNSAILATSWPHHGGKRFNSPIVVDIELPMCQDGNVSPAIASTSDPNTTP